MKKSLAALVVVLMLSSASSALAYTVNFFNARYESASGSVLQIEKFNVPIPLDALRAAAEERGITALTKVVFTFVVEGFLPPRSMASNFSTLSMFISHYDPSSDSLYQSASLPLLLRYVTESYEGVGYAATFSGNGVNGSAFTWFSDILLSNEQGPPSIGLKSYGDALWPKYVDVAFYGSNTAATPAPAAILLLGSGLAGLGVLRRRVAR